MSLTLTPDADPLVPGEESIFTLTVSAQTANAAGVFVDAQGAGTFRTLSGEGLAEVDAGLTHFEAKPASGRSVSFRFAWTPPEAPGGVHFDVFAVAANGDGRSSGDAAGGSGFDFVFGCEPSTFYADLDGDGAGREDRPRLDCVGASPPGLAATGDDCNDNNSSIHPGAPEYCNNIDDDCDGEVDEGSLPVDQYPDADGDGYYSAEERASGDVVSGCLEPGYAAAAGDCQPNDASIHPGAEEVCNQYDDDCDGNVDEGVRPQCGEGWCLRDATSCDGSICTPGEPRSEECNLFDDDCDGEVDEDARCPSGEACIAGLCRASAQSTQAAAEGTTETSGSTNASSSGGASQGGNSQGGSSSQGGNDAQGGNDGTSAAPPDIPSADLPDTKNGGCTMVEAPRTAWPLFIAGALFIPRRLLRRRASLPRREGLATRTPGAGQAD